MLDATTFEYVKPSDEQLAVMASVRAAFADVAAILGQKLPEGPDKTYALRQLRTCAMWANVAITRQTDGGQR